MEEDKPKRKHTGAAARRKGNAYELKIIKELTELGYPGLKSSRSESKNLDNDKIDIADTQNVLDFYAQIKKTKVYPSVDIIKECPRKDKPLLIFWAKQINKEINMATDGEYVIMPKDYFYKLIDKGK